MVFYFYNIAHVQIDLLLFFTWSLLSSHYNKHKITVGVTQDEVWHPHLSVGLPASPLKKKWNILYGCALASDDYIQQDGGERNLNASWNHLIPHLFIFWAAETASSVSKCAKIAPYFSPAQCWSKCKRNEFNQYHILFPDTCRNPHIYITQRRTDISAQHKWLCALTDSAGRMLGLESTL